MAEETELKETPADESVKKRKRPIWLRILKWLLVTFGIVAVLLIIAVCAVVAILKPERLTPLVERLASENLDARVEAGRVELFFMSTFPRFEVEIDSLDILSERFNSLPPQARAALPAYADSLLAVERFHGSIDILSLLAGEIKVYDVDIRRPRVNIVQLNDTVANYDVAPRTPEAPEEKPQPDATLTLPSIAIDRFAIVGDAPLRYYSAADSTELTVTLAQTGLTGDRAPLYQLSISGDGAARIPGLIDMQGVEFSADGDIEWNHRNPMALAVSGFRLAACGVSLNFDSSLDFSGAPTVNAFRLTDANIDVARLAEFVPGQYAKYVKPLETDMKLSLKARLNRPFTIGVDSIPDVSAEIEAPECHIAYDRLDLNRFALKAKVDVPDGNLDRLTLDLERLLAVGRSVGFSLNCRLDAAGKLADPLLKGKFEGGIGFARLPRQLLERLPMKLAGRMTGTIDFRFRPSYLTDRLIHKIGADGEVKLTGFDMAMRDSSAFASADRAILSFGASRRFKGENITVDSLLTVRLDVDTARFRSEGLEFRGVNLNVSAGARNVAENRDTTAIIPVALGISGERLSLNSAADSTHIRLRDLDIRGSILRYQGNSRRPRISLSVGSRSIVYRDQLNRLTLRRPSVSLTLHPRSVPRLSRRGTAVFDSLTALYPRLTVDSVYSLTRLELAAERKARTGGPRGGASKRRADSLSTASGDLDLQVDRSLKSWLRLWEASGSIQASRGRAFTPYFPLRNRLDSLDIDFSTDSVVVRHALLRAGETSIAINGHIANISQALTSRRAQPIEVALRLDCDTLDVNAIAEAAFAGSSFSQRKDSIDIVIADSDDDEAVQRSIAQATASDKKLAFLVPRNVKANLDFSARHMRYADVWFSDVIGVVGMADGALKLDRLSANADLGSLNMTMLYSAPDPADIDFAAGILLRRLDLKKMLRMMPDVDSLLPLLRSVEGIVTADLALTTKLDSAMDLRFNTLKAVMKLEGDSLVLLDSETFRTLSKWLMFKQKNRNLIDRMSVELMVDNNYLQILPFMFDFDRYRLGVWGGNDLDMNYDYHVAVLKSPLPFKFGVTIRGQGDNFKFRLGKANFSPDKVVTSRQLTDTTRVNLIKEIRNVFEAGVRAGRRTPGMNLGQAAAAARQMGVADETLSHADSVMLMKEGVIEMTPAVADSISAADSGVKVKNKRKTKKQKKNDR